MEDGDHLLVFDRAAFVGVLLLFLWLFLGLFLLLLWDDRLRWRNVSFLDLLIPGRLITIPYFLILIKMQFRLIVRRRRQQIPPEIHLLIAIPTMIHLLLHLLSIRQQAIPSVKLDIILGKHLHGLQHLAMGFEVQEESTFRVDEVEEVMRGDVLQCYFGLEDQAVQEVDWRWRHWAG